MAVDAIVLRSVGLKVDMGRNMAICLIAIATTALIPITLIINIYLFLGAISNGFGKFSIGTPAMAFSIKFRQIGAT
jgi:hypothetical protein